MRKMVTALNPTLSTQHSTSDPPATDMPTSAVAEVATTDSTQPADVVPTKDKESTAAPATTADSGAMPTDQYVEQGIGEIVTRVYLWHIPITWICILWVLCPTPS